MGDQVAKEVYDANTKALAVARIETENFRTRVETDNATVRIDDITDGGVALVAVHRDGDVEQEQYIRIPADGAEQIGKALQNGAKYARKQVSKE